MGLYEVPLSMSLLSFGMGTMLANFHVCGIILVLRSVFDMLVMNESKRAYVFYLPCESLFYLVVLPLGPELW